MFKKGNSYGQLTSRKGTPNKLNIDIREKFYNAYENMGEADKISGDQAFLEWARKNPKTFYTLFAKLAPTNLNIHDGREHESFIDRMAQEMLQEAQAKTLEESDVNGKPKLIESKGEL